MEINLSSEFIIKLILSFIVGSSWVTMATIIAERAGTRLGGMIAGFPSTCVIAFFFMGWAQSPQVAFNATTIFPLAMVVTTAFNVSFIIFTRSFRFISAVSLSLFIWFILSALLIISDIDNYIISLIAFTAAIIIAYYIIEHMMIVNSIDGRPIVFSFGQIIFRAVLSGGMIANAVLLAKLLGPFWGGLFAAFPAATLSTLIIAQHASGKFFAAAILKVIIIAGSLNVVLYSILIRYFYLYIGLIPGTLFALLLTLGSTYFFYYYLIQHMK